MSTVESLTSIQPADLPDVAELTRRANAYFSALPGESVNVDTWASQAASAQPASAGVPVSAPATGSSNIPTTVPGSGAQNGSSIPSATYKAPAATLIAEPRRKPVSTEPELSALIKSASFYFLESNSASGQSLPGHTFNSQLPGTAGVPGTSSLNGFNHTPGTLTGSAPHFDVAAYRRDFPIFREHVNGQPLVWLDNAATTQKPQVVIDRLSYFYEHENSNIHRAAHELAARATDAYEGAREISRRFLNASSTNEIVFVRGTTEAINLVAKSWGHENIGQDDEIIITWLEHHANIVPWQQLCTAKGAKLRVVPVDDNGQVILEEYEKLLNGRTKLVSLTQVSNALGTITPAAEMVRMAHRHGARVLVDGAQSVSHLRADVQQLDCDWFVFSGHKIFGPTGIGVLYGKEELLNSTGPWQGGGNMIKDVTFEKTEYHAAPGRFEAGTGNIADAVGLGAALEYVERIGQENIARYEHELLVYGMHHLADIPGLRLIGTAPDKASVMSFVLDGFTTEEVGHELNKVGVAVRTGHHCAQPILRRFGLEATVRPSLALYNTYADIDLLVSTVKRLKNSRR